MKNIFKKEKFKLPLISLGTNLENVNAILKNYTKEETESQYANASDLVFQNNQNIITVSLIDNNVVAVIYNLQSFRESKEEREHKLKFYVESYHKLNNVKFLIDNGFGYLYKSEDNKISAAYSYVKDIFSIRFIELQKK